MRKTTAKILTGLAIVVIALAAIYAVAVGISALKLRRAYADLEKDGRPMRAADLRPAGIPDTKNAALLYESAILWLQAQPAGESNLLRHLGGLSRRYVDGTLDPNQQVEFRQLIHLDTVAGALRLVEQGTTRPACSFNGPYDQRGFPFLPRLNELRELTRLLAAKTILEAEDGRMDRVWDMAIMQLRFADALRTERAFVVSQLVRVAQIASACKTIERLCDGSAPNEQQYQHIQTLLEGFDDISPLKPTVDAERLQGEWIFNLPKDELWREMQSTLFGRSYVPDILNRLQFYRLTFKPRFLADHAAYLRLMHGYARLFEQPYEHQETDEFEKLYDKIARGHRLTETLSPAIGRVKEIYVRMIAQTRVTRTGLALLQYRKTHGALPNTLDALALPHTQDPFSQKSLLYRPEAQGFVLYSVGPDRKDNGGIPRPPKGDAEYDLVWRFPNRSD